MTLVVVGLLLNLLCYTSVNASSKQEDAQFVNKIKASIAKLGTGFEARVEVKLRDKTKIRGYVSEARNKYFVVVNDDTHAPTQVSYSQVEKVTGKNHPNGRDVRKILDYVVPIGLIVWIAAGVISTGGDF